MQLAVFEKLNKMMHNNNLFLGGNVIISSTIFISSSFKMSALFSVSSILSYLSSRVPSTEINTVKSFLLLLKVFLPLIVPQWCHLPSKNISETFKNRQNFPSLSSRTRINESLGLRLVPDSDSVSLYMVGQVSVSDSDSNFSSVLVSSLESDHFGGLLY